MQRETITAPELAERFEVSRRTINRDIEAICKAGIPLVTARGRNGGISIMEGFAINKTLLTSSDLQALLTGLQGLDSIANNNRYQQLMEKLSAGQAAALLNERSIKVDLSSWYKLSLAPKIELIQRAINAKQKIRFDYYAPAGESSRTIEPYLLIYQWSAWYVWGYCLKRNDFRLFKLNRINCLCCTDETYAPREQPTFQTGQGCFGAPIHAIAIVQPQMKWRLIEEFGIDCFCEREDGRLLFQFDFMDKQNLIGWIFSFGDKIELIEPASIRDEIIDLSKKILYRYEKHDT